MKTKILTYTFKFHTGDNEWGAFQALTDTNPNIFHPGIIEDHGFTHDSFVIKSTQCVSNNAILTCLRRNGFPSAHFSQGVFNLTTDPN